MMHDEKLEVHYDSSNVYGYDWSRLMRSLGPKEDVTLITMYDSSLPGAYGYTYT